ncbi:iron ABC transporter permease [Bradyrhizobium sp. LHD-71]|uniref:ABC transporter permease n=1 Tax=Bradyrhizobium sp. LHD-71 TaxID=3072141 RepID=UPI00280E2315|nr:iron ABC transporter permease [Bradyrhizobium sp. LHD-71]MDQ8731458.1 iron ABC transporter permease [Bradyrhizobium sp. LHD-71]
MTEASAIPERIEAIDRGRSVAGERIRAAVTWLFLAVVTVLVVTPMAAIVFGAFRTRSPGDPRATFSLQSIEAVYLGLFNGGWTQSATLHTVLLAIPVTISATALGLFLAWAVTRTNMPGKRWFEFGFLLSLLYSPLVGVIGWTVLADPAAGLLNGLWSALTGASDPLFNIYSYGGIAWVMIFFFAPYAFLLNVGGFRSLDVTLEEVAAVSGANLFKRMMLITLPVMMAGIAAAALFIFTLALEQFAIPGFLGTHVQFDTLAYAIFLRTNAYPSDLPGAAAAGTLLLILSSIGLFAYRRLTRHSERFVAVTARGYKPGVTELGAGRYVLFGVCLLIFIVGIAAPLIAVALRALLPVRTMTFDPGSLTLDNFRVLFSAADMLLGLRNTFYLAFGAATACSVIGLVVAFQITRRKSLAKSILDYMIALPIGVPGTVFGVGMLWAYVRTPLYLTLGILLLAFVIRYLVYSVRSIGGALMQIDKALEESAAVAGATPFKSFMFVNLPLLRPVLASAWLLVFLIVMREISSSIILYGAHTVTLPILTWNYLNDGSYGVASALAITQIGIVGVVFIVLTRFFGADLRARAAE